MARHPATTRPTLPTVNAPTNGATGVALTPTLNVGVSDTDDDALTVTFFGRPFASGNFTQIGAANSGVPSGTNTTKAWANLGAGQSYEWYVTVSDGTTTRTGPTWTFHTVASTDPVFVGAGDIASCAITEDTATGNVVGRHRRRRLDDRRQRLRQRPGERVHELLRHHAVGQRPASRTARAP